MRTDEKKKKNRLKKKLALVYCEVGEYFYSAQRQLDADANALVHFE